MPWKQLLCVTINLQTWEFIDEREKAMAAPRDGAWRGGPWVNARGVRALQSEPQPWTRNRTS